MAMSAMKPCIGSRADIQDMQRVSTIKTRCISWCERSYNKKMGITLRDFKEIIRFNIAHGLKQSILGLGAPGRRGTKGDFAVG